MRTNLFFIALACIAGTIAIFGLANADDVPTVSLNDGVFTEAQSRRGESEYLKTCRECHERNLMGGGYDDIPPLIGDEFLTNWVTWSVGDLYDFMENEMPPKRKDRVGITEQNYVEILAYILEQNGYPKGNIELPAGFDRLSRIEMKTDK